MSPSEREDRIILTVAAIGRGIGSDPEAIQDLQRRQRLEEALDPFRKPGKRDRRSFDEILEEQTEEGTPD